MIRNMIRILVICSWYCFYPQAKGGDLTCYRGDQSMVALGSAVFVKILMLLPALLKVIAAKAIFGLVMGLMSVILSKMAILPMLLSYGKKHHAGLTSANSYRQGANPTEFAMTTDSYGLFYQQEEQPGRITTAEGLIDNRISSSGHDPGAAIDNHLSESKLSNRNYNIPSKDFKYVPRKDRYRSIQRRAVFKPRRSGYPEILLNGKNIIAMLATVIPNTEANDKGGENDEQTEPSVRAKRWLGHFIPIYQAKRSI